MAAWLSAQAPEYHAGAREIGKRLVALLTTGGTPDGTPAGGTMAVQRAVANWPLVHLLGRLGAAGTNLRGLAVQVTAAVWLLRISSVQPNYTVAVAQWAAQLPPERARELPQHLRDIVAVAAAAAAAAAVNSSN